MLYMAQLKLVQSNTVQNICKKWSENKKAPEIYNNWTKNLNAADKQIHFNSWNCCVII